MGNKRLTDEDIWVDKEWFINLDPVDKCAFMFIKARCDNVGVWVPYFKMAEGCIGKEVDWDALPKKCHDNIEILDNGKWWIIDFCAFQHADLIEYLIDKQDPLRTPKDLNTRKALKSYIRLLEQHGLTQRVLEVYAKGLYAPKVRQGEVRQGKAPIPEEEQAKIHEFINGTSKKMGADV